MLGPPPDRELGGDHQAPGFGRICFRFVTTKMSENGDIYTAGKNFTLPPAVTALTNSTSALLHIKLAQTVTNFSAKIVRVSQSGRAIKKLYIFAIRLFIYILRNTNLGLRENPPLPSQPALSNSPP